MVHPALVFQDGMEQMVHPKSQLTAALVDRNGAVQVYPPAATLEHSYSGGAQESEANRGGGSDSHQLSSRLVRDMPLFRGPVSSSQGDNHRFLHNQQQHGHRFDYDGEYEYPARRQGDLNPAHPRVQQQHGTFEYDHSMRLTGFPAGLIASGTSVQSHRSSVPSSPATPPDEPKGRRSALARLSQVPAPTSQASTDQVGNQQLLGPVAVIWTLHTCRPACAICASLPEQYCPVVQSNKYVPVWAEQRAWVNC